MIVFESFLWYYFFFNFTTKLHTINLNRLKNTHKSNINSVKSINKFNSTLNNQEVIMVDNIIVNKINVKKNKILIIRINYENIWNWLHKSIMRMNIFY